MKSNMIATNGMVMVALVVVGFLAIFSSPAEAAPHVSSNPGFYTDMNNMENGNPEYIMQTLARLRQALLAEEDLENSKRGLDLGLGRGFSGSQAAKHLMGLAAANFAGGPGRRRRSEDAA